MDDVRKSMGLEYGSNHSSNDSPKNGSDDKLAKDSTK
jgi:hypothetical protein